jgi:hypothetical protein
VSHGGKERDREITKSQSRDLMITKTIRSEPS